MKMNELKQNLNEINRDWRVTLPTLIFGYAPIKDRAGEENFRVLVDGVEMTNIREIYVMRELPGDLQMLMMIGKIVINGKSLKQAMRDIETARVEIIGEKWNGMMSCLTVEVVGPAEVAEI